MKDFFRRHFRLVWLQALIGFGYSGVMSVLALHFYKQHISLADFLLADGIAYGINALYIATRGSYKTPRDMRIGFALLIAAILILAFVPFSRAVYYIYDIVQCVGAIIFYVPYNILFFGHSDLTKNNETMVRYWGVIILVNIFGPLIGAFLLERYGLFVFLMITLTMTLNAMWCTQFVTRMSVRYSVREACAHIKPLRLIVFLDGTQTKIPTTVALFALLYLTTTQSYGAFLSAVALVALIGAFGLAKRSDKKSTRLGYIIPTSLIAGVVTMLFVYAKTFPIFLVLILMLRAASVLSDPLRSTIIKDIIPESPLNWISRELYLNMGRAGMLVCAAFLVRASLPAYAFGMMGFLYLVFPYVVYAKKIYSGRPRAT